MANNLLGTIGKDALQVLKTVAPTLATAIGGPFGTLAAATLTAVLGTSPTSGASSSSISGSISQILASASPEDLVKIKQAEEAFKEKMAELGIQEESLVYADVASARQAYVSSRSRTPAFLTYVILLAGMTAFLSLLFGVIHAPTDPNQAVIFGSVLTFLFTESKSVIAFWLGGVYDSKTKDQDVDLSVFGGVAAKGSRK